MGDTCDTVKIADSSAPGGHVVINKEDFDKSKHKEYVEPKEPAKSKDEKANG